MINEMTYGQFPTAPKSLERFMQRYPLFFCFGPDQPAPGAPHRPWDDCAHNSCSDMRSAWLSA